MRIPGRFLSTSAGHNGVRPQERPLRNFSEAWKLPQPLFLLIRQPITAVLVLLAMLAIGGMLIGRIQMLDAISQKRTPYQVATSELYVLRTALELFRRDCGRYPTSEEGLAALVVNPGVAEWKGPYITLLKPDPWRTWYRYERLEENVVLFSCGPDRVRGTSDDIAAPQVTLNDPISEPRQSPPQEPESTPKAPLP